MPTLYLANNKAGELFRDSGEGMPSKLQLKTLSASGELLNVINCSAGRISVFRGNTPADLRPFQRALIGISGKEKMVVAVDGGDYNHDSHNVVGLGEAPPHAGLTVREFFAKAGVRDAALESLLNSHGLESTAETKVSALSPDQERRVRILVAVSQPDKALIINEPFEVLTSQWKERFAEVLLDFARAKNGLIVIPSLSYRPDSWIDNSLIARIEVGQSIQRTIGFGQAGSEANQMMEDLKRRLREENAEEGKGARNAAFAAGAGAMLPGTDAGGEPPSDLAMIKSWLLGSESKTFKLLSTLFAAAIGVGSAVVIMNATQQDAATSKPQTVAAVQPLAQGEKPKQSSTNAIEKALEPPKQAANTGDVSKVSPPVKVRFVLDDYPEVIRASVIETSHGTVGEVAEPEEQQPTQPANSAKSGNLYSLLEKAGSESSGGGSASPPPPVEEEEPEYAEEPFEADEPQNQAEEDQKREEIRAKFLEAIRAAAERREAAMDEE